MKIGNCIIKMPRTKDQIWKGEQIKKRIDILQKKRDSLDEKIHEELMYKLDLSFVILDLYDLYAKKIGFSNAMEWIQYYKKRDESKEKRA